MRDRARFYERDLIWATKAFCTRVYMFSTEFFKVIIHNKVPRDNKNNGVLPLLHCTANI